MGYSFPVLPVQTDVEKPLETPEASDPVVQEVLDYVHMQYQRNAQVHRANTSPFLPGTTTEVVLFITTLAGPGETQALGS